MLPGERKKNKICRDSGYHWPQINKRRSATAFKAKYFPVQKEVITMSSQDDGGISPLNQIPDVEVDAIARRLLPKIQAFYESAEGKKIFEEWKKEHGIT